VVWELEARCLGCCESFESRFRCSEFFLRAARPRAGALGFGWGGPLGLRFVGIRDSLEVVCFVKSGVKTPHL
jgi:hypothetical protein